MEDNKNEIDCSCKGFNAAFGAMLGVTLGRLETVPKLVPQLRARAA